MAALATRANKRCQSGPCLEGPNGGQRDATPHYVHLCAVRTVITFGTGYWGGQQGIDMFSVIFRDGTRARYLALAAGVFRALPAVADAECEPVRYLTISAISHSGRMQSGLRRGVLEGQFKGSACVLMQDLQGNQPRTTLPL